MEKIKFYSRNQSYCDPNSAVRVYNPNTPEWLEMGDDLTQIDVIPFMPCWTREGELVVSPGSRGNDAISAGVSSRNYKERTKLSRVAIPALLKGTEHAVSNMVVLSRILKKLGIGHHPTDQQGSLDGFPFHWMGITTEGIDGSCYSDALVRLNLFARTLDPSNILEGLTGAVMDLATSSLNYHVDALDDRVPGNNFTIIFSFLCAERTGFPTEKPSRVLRFSMLGYQRKVVGDFLRRWKTQLRYLDEITYGFDKMGKYQISFDPDIFDNALPDCILGISAPTKKEPVRVVRNAFGLPMCMNRNLYASSFVHAIRMAYLLGDAAHSLVTDDLYELVVVVALCNDNFKFPCIVHGCIHEEYQHNESCVDVQDSNFAFYVLWKMQRVFGSRVAGVMSVGAQTRTLSDVGTITQFELSSHGKALRECVCSINDILERNAENKSCNEQRSVQVNYTHDTFTKFDFNYLVERVEEAIPYHDYYSLECAVRVLVLLGLLGRYALPMVTPYAIHRDVSDSVWLLSKKAERSGDSTQKVNEKVRM